MSWDRGLDLGLSRTLMPFFELLSLLLKNKSLLTCPNIQVAFLLSEVILYIITTKWFHIIVNTFPLKFGNLENNYKNICELIQKKINNENLLVIKSKTILYCTI